MTTRKPATEKAKATRQRSWQRNQEAKKERIAKNDAQHAYNVKVGSTGKQRANAQAKQIKAMNAQFTSLSDPENVQLEEVSTDA